MNLVVGTFDSWLPPLSLLFLARMQLLRGVWECVGMALTVTESRGCYQHSKFPVVLFVAPSKMPLSHF